MRIAWFSPMPPVRSGIAIVSAGLVAALVAEHDIDVFVDEPVARRARAAAFPAEHPLPLSAHEFVWRHARQPYDVTVYQLGNSSHHDYLWPYLFRYPGLVVLHDAHLHHARAALLLRQGRARDYRAEFAANDADTNPDAAELAVAGFDSALYYEWPFTRLVVAASRVTAVHSPVVAGWLRAAHPGARIEHVRLGHGVPLDPVGCDTHGRAARQRLGVPLDATLFGCFGGLAPEKRVPQVLEAFAAVAPYVPRARLLLAGPVALHYDVAADVAARGVVDRTIVTGYLPTDDDLTDAIAACDVALSLRWPTARELSGPWLRCLAAGRATIVTDTAQLVDVPSLDPRTWAPAPPGTAAPVTVAVDILDELHSLRLAMRRLGTDSALRRTLGDRARDYWHTHHAQDRMLEDYRRVLGRAVAAPPPHPALPAHLVAGGDALLTRTLDGLGVPVPWSKM